VKKIIKSIKKCNKSASVYFLNRIDSTNAFAREKARKGETEATVVIAKKQTAGRGRLGRSFISPKGGVYMSVVLRPKILPQDATIITAAAAVAVCRAIEAVSDKKCEIKWVNDIYIEGKKVCGILTEGEFAGKKSFEFVVLGVGINLFAPRGGFPKELTFAGSIFKRKFRKKKIKEKIICKFLNEFFYFYENLQEKEFIKEYQSRSILTGKEISYKKEDKTHTGRVVGIDENAQLLVKEGESTIALSTGEVQIVAAEGLFERKL